MKPNLERLTQTLLELLDTPSPTGYTGQAFALLERDLRALGLGWSRTRKGGLCWTLAGQPGGEQVCFVTHLDTLGAMVREIKPSGRLKLAALGSYDWPTVEGEYASVHLESGETLRGTVVNVRQSVHIFGHDMAQITRRAEDLELRLDHRTSSAAETAALGVRIGDYLSWDSRAEATPSGYIKGRHLDNKAAVAVCLEVTRALLEAQETPLHTTHFLVTAFEEVGHGASSGLPEPLDALIAVDMAAVGQGQNSSEHHCSLGHLDYLGPYDRALSLRLRSVARRRGVELRDDVYSWYNSDGGAAWKAGLDAPVALIGPGVDASHAYERTHLDALEATYTVILGFMLEG